MKKYYTGIGSRETPEDILYIMSLLAMLLKRLGYTLRSGGAEGADTYFEMGAGDNKEIYLPWNGFNNNTSSFIEIPKKAYTIAETHHPAWKRLTQGAKRLHARNVMQVLGKNLKTKSKFVVCWTPKGELKGGTAQAMRIANFYAVPVYNLALPKHKKRLIERIKIITNKYVGR